MVVQLLLDPIHQITANFLQRPKRLSSSRQKNFVPDSAKSQQYIMITKAVLNNSIHTISSAVSLRIRASKQDKLYDVSMVSQQLRERLCYGVAQRQNEPRP